MERVAFHVVLNGVKDLFMDHPDISGDGDGLNRSLVSFCLSEHCQTSANLCSVEMQRVAEVVGNAFLLFG